MRVGFAPPRTEELLPRFDTPNVLWFFGAIATATTSIALIANVHASDRGVWIFLVSLALMALYAVLSALLRRSGWWVPGGLFATVVVSLVPALGVGFEHLVGVQPNLSLDPGRDFEGSIFALALVTMIAGLIAFALVRFHFVLAVVTLAALATGQFFLPAVDSSPSADAHAAAAIVSGGILITIGLWLDLPGHRRAAFWWHVLGLGGIAVGLVYYVETSSSGGWAAMLVTGAIVLLLAAPLRRATWGVYGTAGVYAPIVHYVSSGTGSWKLPLVLLFVSLAVLFLGMVLHQLRGVLLEQWLQRLRSAPPP